MKNTSVVTDSATRPAGRRPSLTDVAALAGVSRSTASLVIREAPGPSQASRERVRLAAAELGYRPDAAAQALAQRRSRLLGVMFDPRDPFHADLIEAIYPAAEKHRYDVVLSAVLPGRDAERAVDALLGSRSEALILLGSRGTDGTTAISRAEGHPVVTVGFRASGADAVHTADDIGARRAVDHLVALGHWEIAHIDGGKHAGAADRRRGYRAAMRSHHLTEHVDIVKGDYTEVSGVAAAQHLLTRDALPTAVFAANDRCAVGLLDALRRSGVDVPGEISVVGYDDSQASRFAHIDLTTVRQDAQQMADLAVDAALQRVDGDGEQIRDILLDPHLVVRSTTGPVRH